MQIKNQANLLILLIIAQVFFASCERDEPFNEPPPASPRRTVLVYLGTDNNFRAEAAEKIEILRQNWSKDTDGNLLVYADNGSCPALVHIYHHTQKGNVADTIETYQSENSASPATLTRVLNRAREYRPAASYGLVVLSHATGWLPAGMSEPSPLLKSVILDKSTSETNNYMELPEFAEAIPYKLDFIIFDACFMGSVEVCYELKDKAGYIVASPAEVLSPGFVYSTMAQHLFAPQPDLTAVAQDFYNYHNAQSGLRRSATVSVIKTAGLEELKIVFQGIAEHTDSYRYHNDTGTDINNLQTFGYGTQKIYFDLGESIQKLAPEQYAEFQTALDRCVIYSAHTDSYYSAGTANMQVVRTFSGLSAYVPQAQYPLANEAYRKLKWVRTVRSVPQKAHP